MDYATLELRVMASMKEHMDRQMMTAMLYGKPTGPGKTATEQARYNEVVRAYCYNDVLLNCRCASIPLATGTEERELTVL